MSYPPRTLNALDYPPRFQWEESSGPPERSAANNCGPTGSSQQTDFYDDHDHPAGIEHQRDRAGIPHGTPTSAWDQERILEVHGVPAETVQLDSLAQLDALLGDGARRPVGIGVLMSRMTAEQRGHSFLGWHRITIICRRRRWSWRRMRRVGGYLYTDPNFSPPGGYRPDPEKGHRWISRAALRYAFIENSPRYAIAPLHRKVAT